MNSKREIPLLFWFLTTAVLLMIGLTFVPPALDALSLLQQGQVVQPPALPVVVTAIPSAPLTNLVVKPPAIQVTAVPQPAAPQPAPASDTGASIRSAPPAGNGQADPAVVDPVVVPEQSAAEEQLSVYTTEGEYEPEFLLACVDGKRAGRRVSPNCPDNAAELLGTGR